MEKSRKQSEFLKSDNPVAEQSRWIISEMGKFASKAKSNPEMKEKNWDDYNVIPERQLPTNQFVADNAVWETKE
jgi:UDP-N-acetylmuramyl tripeptide synthase